MMRTLAPRQRAIRALHVLAGGLLLASVRAAQGEPDYVTLPQFVARHAGANPCPVGTPVLHFDGTVQLMRHDGLLTMESRVDGQAFTWAYRAERAQRGVVMTAGGVRDGCLRYAGPVGFGADAIEVFEPDTIADSLCRTVALGDLLPGPSSEVVPDSADSAESAHIPDVNEFIPVSEAPKILHKTEPVYPDVARNHAIEGQVMLKMLVGLDGSVVRTVILKSEPEGVFDSAAVHAARQTLFSPALIEGGIPVSVWVTVPYRFRLR